MSDFIHIQWRVARSIAYYNIHTPVTYHNLTLLLHLRHFAKHNIAVRTYSWYWNDNRQFHHRYRQHKATARCHYRNKRGIHAHAQFRDRKSTRLNSSHANISYAVFCLKKKKETVDG